MAIKARGKIPGQNINRTFIEVKGRSDYECSVCGNTIPKGVKHFRYATFTDRGPARVHIRCVRLEGDE